MTAEVKEEAEASWLPAIFGDSWQRRTGMEAVTIFLGAILVVFLVRIPRSLAPQHYFGIHEIIHGMNNAVTWQAIVLRFSIPFVVAAIGALALRDSPVLVGLGIGFLASVLLVWPAFLDQRLLPWPVVDRRNELYLLYCMFIASFTLLGLSAGLLASYLQGPLEEAFGGTGGQKVLDAAGSRIGDVVVGLFVILIASVLAWTWRALHKHIQRSPELLDSDLDETEQYADEEY